MTTNRTVVLDTSAFIAGFDPLSIRERQYSVPAVQKELSSNSMSLMRFNAAVENRRLKVRMPRIFLLKKIKEVSKRVGDIRYLSEADMEVLALALELKSEGLDPLIVTDDYSIQNVANEISVKFTSLITYGIQFSFDWILYCPACHRKYPSDYKFKVCEVCGTEIKRKPFRKTPLGVMKQRRA